MGAVQYENVYKLLLPWSTSWLVRLARPRLGRGVGKCCGLLADANDDGGTREDGACFQHKFPLDCGSGSGSGKLHVA